MLVCVSPKVHAYEAIVPSESEDVLVNVQLAPEHDWLNDATGGAFTGIVTVTFCVAVLLALPGRPSP